ncbi:hypothetical protein BGAL_0427g00010 [Botrytis galanthina]|uniref:Uncharacterized protein n=1 Tax=Botrytis galanthina TaxID=278940 RepID=A0A4V6T6V1_9HELO|nr:hypothetical protein BGAL_0427g00010 [Botrytis galanthina]
MGGGSFIGDEVGRVGVGVEDGYLGDEEEYCESLLGKFNEEEEGEEEEEDDDERITNNHHIKNKHIDLSQASRENADAPHQQDQDQNLSEADYHSGDTSAEENGSASLYF